MKKKKQRKSVFVANYIEEKKYNVPILSRQTKNITINVIQKYDLFDIVEVSSYPCAIIEIVSGYEWDIIYEILLM